VLGQSTYNTAERDYAASIMQVLRTDDSRARQQRVQATIGQKLEFEPRRRADIQFIFAPSNLPTPARLLRPQLRFHLAGDIPTYTLGDAYEPHPTANEEIEGIMFPDMPWMVGDTSLTAEVRTAAAQAFGDSAARRGRLFAFGFDAMRLASSLQRGAPIGPEGLTGTLSMDAQGRVRRDLDWVRIKSGAPVPMEAYARRHRAVNARATAWIAGRPDRWPKTAPARSSKRRVSPSWRATSCSASANSTSWRAPATC
jgi:outer membrane PBP1 activator LpoA protein